MSMFSGLFKKGDEWLDDDGGQMILDGTGMVPGAGEVVDATQATYHQWHMWNDLAEGNWGGAKKELRESGKSAIHALPGAHEALEIPDIIELGVDATKYLLNHDDRQPVGTPIKAGVESGERQVERDRQEQEKLNNTCLAYSSGSRAGSASSNWGSRECTYRGNPKAPGTWRPVGNQAATLPAPLAKQYGEWAQQRSLNDPEIYDGGTDTADDNVYAHYAQ